MRTTTHRRAEQYIKQAKKRRVRGRIVAGLSVVVALATTYALMLPGITMEREAQCGVEAHQHTEECYTSSLICTEEEREAALLELTGLNCSFQPHQHTGDCYNAEGELGCGQTSEYFHRHSEVCTDEAGELICVLREKIKRNHTDSCYEERSTLICDTAETEGHQHTESCYTQQQAQEPACGLAENDGHAHTEACERISLICTEEESGGHAHTDACKQAESSLVCTETETPAHSHGEGCYQTVSELTCGKNEGEGAHGHGDSCYTSVSTLICGQAEGEGAHSHGDDCYIEESALVCADETHEHDSSCYITEKKLTCTANESAGHAHGDGCYTEEAKLTCELAEAAGHTHDDSCYTSREELTCTTAETAGHTHGEGCYATTESIICGVEEGAGAHTHGESCYTSEIVCGLEVGAGAHQHEAACYPVAEVLTCGQEAGAGTHAHGEACYVVETLLTCDHDDLHEHDASCYETDKNGKRWAICGQVELESHQHGENCLSVTTVTVEGHAHGVACYESRLVCQVGEHTHTDECYPDAAVEEPAAEPTEETTAEPTATVEVTVEPTAEPTATVEPAEEPTAEPTATVEPTEEPTAEPTATVELTEEPTAEPTATVEPAEEPTAEPTATVESTEEPTAEPTATVEPAEEPTAEPTATVESTEEPTAEPTATVEPAEEPTAEPTAAVESTEEPTAEPTATVAVTEEPTAEPTAEPTEAPTAQPTAVSEVKASSTAAPTLTAIVPIATESDLGEATVEESVPETVYYCGLTEHEHSEACLDENWKIVCGAEAHTHTEDCSHACGLAAHTHSTGVQGDIMLLDESASSCYDADGNLICELEEHTHSEVCAISEDAVTQETTDVAFTLSNVNADVTFDATNDELDLAFSANYVISTSVAKNYSAEDPLAVPLEGIDASQLLADYGEVWLEDSDGNGMMYRFVQKDDGSYEMQIYYTDEALNKTDGMIEGTIKFNAVLDTTSVNDEGDYTIKVGEEKVTIEPSEIYDENTDETLNYDINVAKSGYASLSDNKLIYTITVETTKGFPAVNLTDVITVPEGLALAGTPAVTGMYLETWATSEPTYAKTDMSSLPALTFDESTNTFTMAIADGLELTDSQTSGKYTITVAYPIISIGTNTSVEVENSVTAKATDETTGESVTDSAAIKHTVTNNTVAKTGWFSADTGKVNWEITINPNGDDIAGAMVTDLGFLEAMGLTAEKLAELEGNAVEAGDVFVLLNNAALQNYTGTNLSISPSSSVSLVKSNGAYYLRFDAGDGGTNTNKYTITYSTDADMSMVNSSETNDYTYIDGSNQVTGSYTVTGISGGQVAKQHNGAEVVAGTEGVYEIDWTSTITLPEGGIPEGGTIEDTLNEPLAWVDGVYTALRWFTQEQMNALFTEMQGQWWWNSGYTIKVKTIQNAKGYKDEWVDFDANAADQQYYGWQITINETLQPKDENSIITLNYSSMMDAAGANASSVSSQNNIKAGDKTTSATYTWNMPVAKKNENNSMGDSSKSVTVDGNTITWYADVYVDDEYEEIVVTDTLPSVTVGEDTITLELSQVKAGQYYSTVFNYSSGVPDVTSQTDNRVQIDVSQVTDGKVSVTLKPDASEDWTWADAGQRVRVYFVCKLPDDVINQYEAGETEQTYAIGTFTNNVAVSVKKTGEEAAEYGSDDHSQTISVYVPAQTVETADQFGKDGVYIDFQSAADSSDGQQKNHVLEYTVDINRFAAEMNEGGSTVTVQDVMTHRTANYMQWSTDAINYNSHWASLMMTVTLDAGSVKLYYAQRDADGQLIYNEDGSLVKGDEVSKGLWSMSYAETVTNPSDPANSQTQHTLTLIVPDNEAFVLDYSYSISIDRDNPVNRCENCNATIPDTIPLQGDWSGLSNKVLYNNEEQANHSTSDQDVWKASSSEVTMNVAMTILKVDANNSSVLLDGAEFTLYAWDATESKFVATNQVYTTEDGTFRIQRSQDGGYAFAEDTAYYIVETASPFGYELPENPTPLYFYFASGDENATFIGPDGFQNDSSYYELSKGGEQLYISNEKVATSVNVSKTWSTTDSSVSIPASVNVYLYRLALSEEQWEKVNAYEAPEGGTGTETQVYTASFTYYREGSIWVNGVEIKNAEIYSDSISIPSGYTLVIDFGTADKSRPGQATTSLKANGDDILSKLIDGQVRIENVDQDITVIGATNWEVSWWETNGNISMSTEKSSTTNPVSNYIYTEDNLNAVLTSTELSAAFDSGFSRVLPLTGSSWSGSWTDLDLLGKDADGNTVHYVYYVQEEDVEGWESSLTGGGSDDGYSYSLTNTYNASRQITTDLHVVKQWQDASGATLDAAQWQPVKVQLYRKVAGSTEEPTLYVHDKYETITINSETGWEYNFTGLPYQVIDASGNVQLTYEYTVKEITTGDFVTSYAASTGTSGDTVTITNKQLTETTEIHVQKQWNAASTTAVRVYLRRYMRPVTAADDTGIETLGEAVSDASFNANDTQYITLDGTATTGAFGHLEKYATVDGIKYYYFYYVEEDAQDAADYDVNYSNNDGLSGNDAATPIVITNAEKSDTSLTVTKLWKNADGSEMTAGMPESVTFTLWQVADGKKTQYGDASYTLSAENGWSMTFKDMPQVNEDGATVTYEVEETATSGYVTAYTNKGIASGSIGITNTATELTISKQWLEADGKTVWADQASTVVYLQVSREGTVLTQAELVQYIAESNVTNEGYIAITGAGGVTLTELPVGSYTVNEVAYSTDGGQTKLSLNGDTAPEWSVNDSASATLNAENVRGSLTVTNTARTQLTINKQWNGLEAGAIPYTVYLRVKNSKDTVIDPVTYGVQEGVIYSYTNGDNSTEKWLVYTGAGSIVLTDLPQGVYTVEEVAYKDGDNVVLLSAAEELPFITTSPQTATLGTTAEATVVNTAQTVVETGEVTVKKAWASGTTVPESIDVQLVQIATPVDGTDTSAGAVTVTFNVVVDNTYTDESSGSDVHYDEVLDTYTATFVSDSEVTWKATYSQGGGWMPDTTNCSAYVKDGSPLSLTTVGTDPCTFVVDLGKVSSNLTICLKVDDWFWGSENANNQLIRDLMWRHGYSVIKPNETVYQTYTLTSGESWQHTFADLPLTSEDGQYTYTYRVEELGAGYIVDYTNNSGVTEGEITVTNTEHEKSLAGLTVEKKWFNTDGSVMASPPANSKVQFRLYANESYNTGETGAWQPTDTVYELSAANNWRLKIDGLVIGKEYFLKEVAIVDGDGTTSLLPYFTIAYSSDEQENNGTITWYSTNTEARNNLDDYNETLYIGNTRKPTYTLPETGGGGTQWYTGGGAMLAGIALTLLYRGNKRKRRAEE